MRRYQVGIDFKNWLQSAEEELEVGNSLHELLQKFRRGSLQPIPSADTRERKEIEHICKVVPGGWSACRGPYPRVAPRSLGHGPLWYKCWVEILCWKLANISSLLEA